MSKRRQKGSGGLYRRHDAPDCPPLLVIGYDDKGKPIKERAEHKCRGRWVGTVEVTIDGERRRKVVYGRTEKEARIKQRAAMQDKDAGNLVLDSMTVEAWFTYWLDHIAKRRLKPQTLRGYRSHINNNVIPVLGRKRLTDLRPAHLRALYDTMRDRGLAEATVRQNHAIIKKALKDAERDGKLARNPAERVDPPGTHTNERRSLSIDEAHRVLDAAHDDARWWLAIFYGMRQGECLGLRWCDIDFERHLIRVEQTLQWGADYKPIFGPPKSRASRRVLPLHPLLEARLKLQAAKDTVARREQIQKLEARLSGIQKGTTDYAVTLAALRDAHDRKDRKPGDLVFSRHGKPIQPKADWNAWRNLIDRATRPPLAPIPYVALHAARNTAASLLEAANVPDRMVAQILGHAQVSITHGYQTADGARLMAAFTASAQLLELEGTPDE